MTDTIQANRFINGEFVTGRYQAGRGEAWWTLSVFQDGSVLASMLGLQRASPDTRAALDYWTVKLSDTPLGTSRREGMALLVDRLRTLAMTQPIRDAGKRRRGEA